jgi:hypothetical protein
MSRHTNKAAQAIRVENAKLKRGRENQKVGDKLPNGAMGFVRAIRTPYGSLYYYVAQPNLDLRKERFLTLLLAIF